MTVITAKEPHQVSTDLEDARARTRGLAYGEIVSAVFPIKVGPRRDDKAWYQVMSLRPLRVEWLPYSDYQVSPEALSNLSKTSIYRLLESDITSD